MGGWKDEKARQGKFDIRLCKLPETMRYGSDCKRNRVGSV